MEAAQEGQGQRLADNLDSTRDWRIFPCAYRKLDSAILVMKTTKGGRRCDSAEALDHAMEWGIFVQ